MTGTITIVMVFSIPIIAILTSHFQKQSKIRHKMIQDEIQLEKLKQENFLLETEKMRLELEKMQLEAPKDKTNLL
jgi:hypothetical protein